MTTYVGSGDERSRLMAEHFAGPPYAKYFLSSASDAAVTEVAS